MSRLIGILAQFGALALVLAVVAFALPAPADAAPMDHEIHHEMADHGAHDCTDCDDDGGRDMSHMGHGCHCVSAVCTPVMPPSGFGLVARELPDLPKPAALFDAKALASVAPPAEPPRT